MQGDFDDLRFTQADGITLVDAWAEVIVTDTSATVWVEFPTTPANTVEQTYYMYYGNAGAASDWDGAATFVNYIGSRTTGYISSLDISGSGYAYRGKIEYDNAATQLDFGFGDSSVRLPSNSIYAESYPDNRHVRRVYAAGASKLNVIESNSWSIDTAYIYDILWDSNGCSWHKDAVQWGATYTGDVPTANMGLFCYVHANTGTFYWQFIRKYAANPPTYAFGSEESVPNSYWYYEMLKRRNS